MLFRSELTAAIKALSALKEPCEVTLHTDSKYISDAFNNGWIYAWEKKGWKKTDGKQVLNPELWQELYALMKKHEVTLEWVKGHAENEYNNLCDKLAVGESKKFLK